MKKTMLAVEAELTKKMGDPKGAFEKMITTPDLKTKYIIQFTYRKKLPNGEFRKDVSTIGVAIKYNPWTGELIENEAKEVCSNLLFSAQ